jgi:phage terminase small subunit
MKAKLSAQQQRFTQEYLIDLNGTQAAIRAGYSSNGAAVAANRLLSIINIQDAIAVGRAKMSERTGITQDRVLTELAKIGFSDIRKVLTDTGQIQDPSQWDNDTAGAVASFEATSAGDDAATVHKFKTWDKLNALEKIGKHLGMFGNRSHVAVDMNATASPAQDLIGYLDAIAKRRGTNAINIESRDLDTL